MALWESFRVALEALWNNKLRTGLTMLGVIIGVTSVLVMVAIVQGIRKQILNQFSGNGANLIFAAYEPRGNSVRRGGFNGLTMEDVRAMQSQCDLITTVSPDAQTGVTASVERRNQSYTLSGILADFPETVNVSLESGRFLGDSDVQTWSKACVIGHKVRMQMFPGQNPLGQPLLCDGNGAAVSLIVVGVLEDKDRGGNGDDFNSTIYVSLSTLQKRFTGSNQINSFTARSRDIAGVETAADQIWALMKRRHPLNYSDIIVDTQEGLLKQIDTLLAGIQLVMGGVGGLALLTGGIGIMNIMLVSVTERTREIGIRKAVGATRGAILLQFVVEAMVVSGLGGLVGVAAGYGLAGLIDHFAHKTLPTFVPFWAAELGFGFAVGVGLFFGIYPAFRASKLDPIAALRYE